VVDRHRHSESVEWTFDTDVDHDVEMTTRPDTLWSRDTQSVSDGRLTQMLTTTSK